MRKSRMQALKSAVTPAEVALALHVEAAGHEEEADWVHWIFQSVRARCEALVFQTTATERANAVEDWKQFVEQTWLPKIAPLLLRSWGAARGGEDELLFSLNAEIGEKLSPSEQERSTAAAQLLLRATQGAKYQAALGVLRNRIEASGVAPHLPTVWAALAALFQLVPVDLLAEYLRQEWLVGTKQCANHDAPQGPLSYTGLAHRALHEMSVFGSPA